MQIFKRTINGDNAIKKKTMNLLTNEQQKSYQNANICYICKEQLPDKHAKDKKYDKVRDDCHYAGKYRGSVHSVCNLEYSVHKKISIVLHNESNYRYHFIIKR